MTNDVISTRPLGRNSLKVSTMGLGTAPIGNLYRAIDEATAIETVQSSLRNGINLFDSAPLYGLGLSEERVGKALSGAPREDYVLSTKVGRVLNPDRSDFVYDYSHDGVMRSLEGSLARLQTDWIDILHIHESEPARDIAKDLEMAFPAMVALRDQGVIKAIGAGMNEWQVLMDLAPNYDFDVFLLAGRYTLLEQTALSFLELCQEQGIGIFLAGVYNSGILATGPNPEAKYNYHNAPPEILDKAQAIQDICKSHDVLLNRAALQFARAHPAVTSLVVGMESATEVQTNLEALTTSIPVEFWHDLHNADLLIDDVPIPN